MIYSKVELINTMQKKLVRNIHLHKLTSNHNFLTPSLFLSSTVTEWKAQDCGISKGAKVCCLQKSIRSRDLRS